MKSSIVLCCIFCLFQVSFNFSLSTHLIRYFMDFSQLNHYYFSSPLIPLITLTLFYMHQTGKPSIIIDIFINNPTNQCAQPLRPLVFLISLSLWSLLHHHLSTAKESSKPCPSSAIDFLLLYSFFLFPLSFFLFRG